MTEKLTPSIVEYSCGCVGFLGTATFLRYCNADYQGYIVGISTKTAADTTDKTFVILTKDAAKNVFDAINKRYSSYLLFVL